MEVEVVRPRLGCEVAITTHATVTQEPRMDIHENARTTPRSRMLMMQRLDAGWTIAAVAAAVGLDGRTVRKWRDRFRAEGGAGLVTARCDRTVRLRGSTALPRPRSQRYAAHACPGR